VIMKITNPRACIHLCLPKIQNPDGFPNLRHLSSKMDGSEVFGISRIEVMECGLLCSSNSRFPTCVDFCHMSSTMDGLDAFEILTGLLPSSGVAPSLGSDDYQFSALDLTAQIYSPARSPPVA